MSTLINILMAEIEALQTAPEDVFWQKEAKKLINDGRIVPAVKAIREGTGWTLLESKRLADFFREHGRWDIEGTLRGIIKEKLAYITSLQDKLDSKQAKLDLLQEELEITRGTTTRIEWPTSRAESKVCRNNSKT